MEAFPNVNWIKESKFEKDLKAEIENAGEYIRDYDRYLEIMEGKTGSR